tara:strand:- start:78 stop:797 length:720 start_codon:yes stop_codon:yes gene_type:complete
MGCDLFASLGNGSLNASFIDGTILSSNLLITPLSEGEKIYQNLEAGLSGSLQAGLSGSLEGSLTSSLEASINFPLNARFCWDDFVECGNQFSFSGGTVYPATFLLQFGAGTGTVTVNSNALTIPDRMIIEYNGEVAIDTGYRGGSAPSCTGTCYFYDYGGANRTDFTDSLTGLTDPITNTVYPDIVTSGFAPDGYPYVTYPGTMTNTFEKNAYFISQAILKVYGPMGGTFWTIDVSCPT